MTASVGSERTLTQPALAGWAMATVVAIYGIGLPITKLIGSTPTVAVSCRLWIAAAVLLLAARSRRALYTRSALFAAIIAGWLVTANLLLAFVAVHRTSVATVAVIQSLQPAVVLVLAGPFLGEVPGRRQIACTTIGVLGAAVVVLGAAPELRADGLGLLAAIGTMITFVGFTMINRLVRTGGAVDPVSWLAVVTLSSAFAVLPMVFMNSTVDQYESIGAADWLCILFLGLIVAVGGHSLLIWVQRFLPAARSTLYLLGMNIVAGAAGWVINGEALTPAQFVGSAIVVLAISMLVADDRAGIPAGPA